MGMEIKLENVSFGYEQEKAVISGINLTIDRPGLVCIIGPNGVGKSTLIKCMNKLIRPQKGTVTIDGKDLAKYTLKDLAKFMGYVPVFTNDAFTMSVVDSVLIGRHGRNKWRTSGADMKMVYKSLKVLGIEDLAMRNLNELSAGQLQKVAIARGLVQEPKILMLDEPTANLDVRHQIYVTELLKAFSERTGMTVIMASHDLNIAAKYADRIVVMAEPGVIHKTGSPPDVITEETIRAVYGVDCEVIYSRERPHVILHSALPVGFAMGPPARG